ncbi:putative outer membrane lipoprotein carrier protein LolA [Magnetofaba australis IT-1]|uniref:Outer-membrane lipoprotein carrier protein n=2 Tax=Magnetofaba TaxID=1472292 RepID=A0A1Y2K4S8_9PROT|nr:putative outer membrane lipoprotein carrier protein LolA [Magnetofaba australis IT-1]
MITLQGRFTQRSEVAGSGDLQESRGQFAAFKPGKFRWDYESPTPQMILSDGATLWFYEQELEQVTRVPAERMDQSPATFLVNGGRIVDQFGWRVRHSDAWNADTVVLMPKSQEGAAAQYQEIAITLAPNKDAILNLEVTDNLGNRSYIFFQDMQRNEPIDKQKFQFTPPKGVDVIDG